MGRFKSWLSPGTVMGFVALVVALGGSSWAASGHPSAHASSTQQSHRLTTSKVKAIADAEIHSLAPSLSVASARSATVAKTANSAKIATNVLSAMVNADGSLLGSIPAGATSSSTSIGIFHVSFGRSIAGCTISASPAGNEAPQLAYVAVGVIDANTLEVDTDNQNHMNAGEPFYVQAICPA